MVEDHREFSAPPQCRFWRIFSCGYKTPVFPCYRDHPKMCPQPGPWGTDLEFNPENHCVLRAPIRAYTRGHALRAPRHQSIHPQSPTSRAFTLRAPRHQSTRYTLRAPRPQSPCHTPEPHQQRIHPRAQHQRSLRHQRSPTYNLSIYIKKRISFEMQGEKVKGV